MPTQKQVTNSQEKWFYFETLEDMKAAFPKLDERFYIKPENDL